MRARNSAGGLRVAGFLTWVAVSVPVLLNPSAVRLPILWGAAYLLFGVLFLLASARTKRALAVYGEALCAILLCACDSTGLSAVLLVVTAGTAPFTLSSRATLSVTCAMTIALAVIDWREQPGWQWQVRTLVYFGFILFAVMAARSAEREAFAATQLRRANAELLGLSALLAEDTRVTERLRMARDLHDQLGHSLTALSLRLELARHGAAGDRDAALAQGQALGKEALARLREVVSDTRAQARFDLRQAVDALAVGARPLEAKVTWPDSGVALDVRTAHALYFCVQESLTNTLKHAHATGIDIVFAQQTETITVRIADNGYASVPMAPGHGLLGMRERVEALGGTLVHTASPSFVITVTVPACAA